MATQEKTYSASEIADIAKALGLSAGQKADPLHGLNYNATSTYGIFSGAGVRPQMYSTLARPMSLARVLPATPSNIQQELLEIHTGVTTTTDTNAADFCADPPGTGAAKVCRQQVLWGKWFKETGINVIPQIGGIRNRADVMREIVNAGPSENPYVPETVFGMRLTGGLSQLAYELYLLGVDLERSMEKVLVSGNNATAYTSTQTGWTAEFNGLDQWIKTGYTDSVTSQACAALDSVVYSYSTTLAGTIVTYLNDLWLSVTQRADIMGMPGTQWAFVMRPELFRALVDVVSDQYSTVRVTGGQYEEANRNSEAVVARADAMLQGRYLLVLGQVVPVILSHGPEFTTTANNTYRSDIYLVPLSWQGGPLTRLEYFDMSNTYLAEFDGFVGSNARALNNGLFLAGRLEGSSSAFCPKFQFASQMRLIMETPHLAGRIDDITFSYTAQTRNPYAGESLYADGGVTYRT